MVETIASYWEPVIRIYGSSLRKELALITLRFPEHRLGFWGEQVAEFEDDTLCFEMAFIEQVNEQTSQLVLVCTAAMAKGIRSGLAEKVEQAPSTSLLIHEAVELLYFHGPHFQDRFGIADAAMGCLHREKIRVLAAGCAGTSIYLVTEEKQGEAAARALADIFVVP